MADIPNVPSFVVKSTETIVNDILYRVLQAFDEIGDGTGRETLTDINPGSVLRTIVEAVCEELGYDPDDTSKLTLYNQLINVYNSGFIDFATGSALDNVVSILGVERKPAGKSTGIITFRRSSVPVSDFSVPIGTIVTTEPSKDGVPLEFETTESGEWLINIIDEEVNYLDVTKEYVLNQKFIHSVQKVLGTKFNVVNYEGRGEATPTNINNAYYVSTADDYADEDSATPSSVPPSTIVGASAGFDSNDYSSISISNDNHSEKTGSTTNSFYQYMLFEFDLSVYVNNISNISKIIPRFEGYGSADTSNGIKCFIWNNSSVTWDLFGENDIASSPANEVTLANVGIANNPIKSAEYVDGDDKVWLLVRTYGKCDVVPSTAPVLGCDYVDLRVSEQDYEFVKGSDYELLNHIHSNSGFDVINWLDYGNKPENNTPFYVDYTPLSLDVPITAVLGGIESNVGLNKIRIIKSGVPEISFCNNYSGTVGGTGIESDNELRFRAKNALQTLGKATTLALKFAILNVSGVRDVSIDDTPTANVVNEPHTFDSGENIQSLNQDGISNISSVSGLLSSVPHNFVEGTDFSLMPDLKSIEWLGGGDKPDNGTVYTVSYTYRQKGYANALVLGDIIPIPPDVLDNIEEVIDETKSAGIIVNVLEPSYIEQNVTAGIYLSSGADWNIVETAVRNKIIQYLNSLEIGEDVIYTELVYTVQSVPGVYDVNITTPSSNVFVPSDQLVTPGTISLSQIL